MRSAHEDLDIKEVTAIARDTLVRQIRELTGEREDIVTAATASPPDDEHDAEGSTIGYERARVNALLEHAERRLHALDTATARSDGDGRRNCERCGQPVPLDRLTALPSALTCATCAERPVALW